MKANNIDALPKRVRDVLWLYVIMPAIKFSVESGDLARTPGIAKKGIEKVQAWLADKGEIEDLSYALHSFVGAKRKLAGIEKILLGWRYAELRDLPQPHSRTCTCEECCG